MSTETKSFPTESTLISKEEFICPLCQCLLFEPVTTSCGHTYCRECILRALDHSTSCPICRSTTHMLPDHSINVLVSTIIQKSFPDEYKQRLAEAQTIRDHSFQLPIFTLDYVLFPGMPLHLHIFEPRYRLMVRRCLEGTRTFGVLLSINGEYSNIGTTTVIESSNILPDGRQILVTRGDRRFKVLSFGQQDGYTTTKVKYIDDDDEEESSENIVQVAKAKITLNKYLNNVSTPETGNTEVVTMEDLTRRFGTMPARPKAFSFWISSILNVPNKHKQDLLELTKTKQRLTKVIETLGLNSCSTKGCTIS